VPMKMGCRRRWRGLSICRRRHRSGKLSAGTGAGGPWARRRRGGRGFGAQTKRMSGWPDHGLRRRWARAGGVSRNGGSPPGRAGQGARARFTSSATSAAHFPISSTRRCALLCMQAVCLHRLTRCCCLLCRLPKRNLTIRTYVVLIGKRKVKLVDSSGICVLLVSERYKRP